VAVGIAACTRTCQGVIQLLVRLVQQLHNKSPWWREDLRERLVLRLDHRAHIKPALQRLHWLPVKARIQFKIATVMHATLNQRGPAYLNNIIKFSTEESGRRHLRSSTTNAAVVMRTRTKFGKRALSVCGPSIWNQIPPHIRNLHSVPAFRKALKTYLFSEII